MAPGTLIRRPLFLLVTDRARLDPSRHNVVAALLAQVSAAVAAGVDLIQVREPTLPDQVLLEVVSRCVDLARGSKTVILVNDRLDIAVAAGAGGVHLRASSVPATIARLHVPAGFLLGRSVHDAAEAVRVTERGGLDYLVIGSVFPSRSKQDVSPCGLEVLGEVVRAVTLPVLAIGGVTVDKSVEVFRAGAVGVAAIGLFAESGPSNRFGGISRVVNEVCRLFLERHAEEY